MSRFFSRLVTLGVFGLAGSTALAAGAVGSPSWSSTAIENLRKAEYHFSMMGESTWSAPNRAQNLRVFLSADGLRVTPRRPAAQPWKAGLSLTGVGRGETLVDAGPPVQPVAVAGDRVDLVRAALTEWYINGEGGIEQGFTLPHPPAPGAGGDPVVIELRVSGDVVAGLSAGRQEVLLRTAPGRVALRYDHLLVLDATGRSLPAWFEVAGDRIRIVTDDDRALYPVVVDPLVTEPDWSDAGGQPSADFGVAVASAGDVNGDGYDDVIVGADEWGNIELDEGAAFLYFGSPLGPSVTPAWRVESNRSAARLGISVASAGDVNGDGYDDVVIGASEYDDDPGTLLEDDEGWAVVFYGSATGLAGGPFATLQDADWWGEGEQEEAAYGRRVASAGDVNNDGYDDLLVGASDFTNDRQFEGGAFVYEGSSTGLGPLGTPDNADWRTEGNQVGSLYGYAAASAGDVNGDGYDDVVIGALDYQNTYQNEGRVQLYLGGPSGLDPNAVWTRDGGRSDITFGVSVAGAGDVNADGYDDVLIGTDSYFDGQPGEGGAFLFAGVESGLLGETPTWIGEIDQGDAFLGFSVACAGDINSDGFDDVIVGAEGYDDTEPDEGAAFVYLGSPTGLPLEPSRTYELNQAGAEFGVAVSGAGDVNADGYDDVIIGADLFTKLELHEGGAFVFFGCQDDERDGVCRSEDNCPDLVNPDQADADLDGIGDLCDDCQDVDLDSICDQPRVLVESSGPGEEVLVQAGSPMRYLANVETINPGIVLEWTELTYVDAQFPPWQVGVYGVGYETESPPNADNLLVTTNPPDPGTISLFTRAGFVIDDVTNVSTLFLGAEWDDAYIAWINGTEVYRSPQMPAGTPLWNTKPDTGHESSNGTVPDYGALQDISFAGIPALRNGQNVLAVGVWNRNEGSTDLVLVPRLSINLPKTSSMYFLANDQDPLLGDTWLQRTFDEVAEGWLAGNFGVGFESATGAEALLNSEVPADTVSVFTRSRVTVDPSSVGSVFLGADYDDGYAIWINAVEVYRSSEMPGMPGTLPAWNASPTPSHESSNGSFPDYGALVDITSVAKPAFIQGENVVAIGVWNNSADTDDLVLVPRLSLNEANIDNCVEDFNPDQADSDDDGIGDACDPDIDDDGLNNPVDNCPMDSNAPEDCDDNPGTPDEQCDLDSDGIGDVCDSCPDDAANDVDADGICVGTGFAPPKIGDEDNCPLTYNPPEDCDDDSQTPDEQCNLDGDEEGDACDPDIDGDEIPNDGDNSGTEGDAPCTGGQTADCDDNCPVNPNEFQEDLDGDGVGDACDCASDNNQAWNTPAALDSVRMAKTDSCGSYACSETGGVCGGDLECDYDYCENMACLLSLGPCGSDVDCESDTCEDYFCRHGDNGCGSNDDCTADVCAGRTCTFGGSCTGDVDCTADFCEGKTCIVTGDDCFSQFDCFGGPTDLCVGQCSIGGNLCADDDACDDDVCGPGNCLYGLNPCTDDAECTDDICEGLCSVGGNVCTSDTGCDAEQIDLCEGTCTLGANPTCNGDSDCTVTQTDLCLGSCTISGFSCSSDAPCTAPDIDTLFWQRPADLGGTGVVYDTLRTPVATDFTTLATCAVTDSAIRITSDGTAPTSGTTLYYLIRVENECPEGNMGSSSSGPRTGKACE